MSLRITTWNVNGIRNPFSYHPWHDKKTFQAMFDILEADIVCIQELKIQRKDLRDDMVLVPGWDCFCTFPKYKKGYSGVAIYTRKSKCNPIKAEEGLTGILVPPGCDGKTYLSLPPSETIGGYPDISRDEAILLDSEGRCLVLDFGAFVLIGLYCPASTVSARDDFRIAFAAALDQRIRNLVEVEKRRLVVVGDLNIARDEIDNAAAKEIMVECGLEDYKDTPTRQILHKLLEPHETGIMVDLCREFFPTRRGMYTCWETKSNSRFVYLQNFMNEQIDFNPIGSREGTLPQILPGNYGQRIDYILCSSDMKAWFVDANIQEGLMGSDHCPVYGVISEKVTLGGNEKHILDVVNPPSLFVDGRRQSSQAAPQLKLSAQATGEYAGRQSIRAMFSKVAAQKNSGAQDVKQPSLNPSGEEIQSSFSTFRAHTTTADSPSVQGNSGEFSPVSTSIDRSTQVNNFQLREPPTKRQKVVSSPRGREPPSTSQRKSSSRGQQSLIGFFKKSSPAPENLALASLARPSLDQQTPEDSITSFTYSSDQHYTDSFLAEHSRVNGKVTPETSVSTIKSQEGSFPSIDPIASKEKWSQLFTKPTVPRCETHNEPCILRVTKKPGQNVGRAFWMCSRPLGPDGARLTNGQAGEWRCNYFKWSSDRNSFSTPGSS